MADAPSPVRGMAWPNVQSTFSGCDWLTKGELGPPVPQSLHKGVRGPPTDHVKSAGASAHALGTLSLMGLAAGAQVGHFRQIMNSYAHEHAQRPRTRDRREGTAAQLYLKVLDFLQRRKITLDFKFIIFII